MKNSKAGNIASQKLSTGTGSQTSIKKRFILFSVIFFVVILFAGSAAFFLSMRQNVWNTTAQELEKQVEIERIKLESSVSGEIAIAMKMADSPLIKRYFQNPDDPALEQIAFEEIAGYRRAFAANTVFWVNDIDKKFYSDDAFAFVMDPYDPVNSWYFMTVNETEKYNFNINYNPDLNKTNLWINAPVFNNTGKALGMLGTGIDLSAFIDSIYKSFSGSGKLYFFNDTGEITGAKDSSLILEKKTIVDELGETGKTILSSAKSLSPGSVISFESMEGVVAVDSVPDLSWYVAIIMPLSIGSILNSSMTFLFLAMIGVIIIIFVIFNFFVTGFLKPLNGIVEFLDRISAEWDLTKRIPIKGNDEVWRLAEFFNLTFERFRELIKNISDKSHSLSETGEDLAVSMNETAAAINEITANVQSMKGEVTTQVNEVNTASAAMERIIGGLDKLNGHIDVQVGSVAQSSSAIEEMLANVRAVTETLVRNSSNIDSLAESSETGRTGLQGVSQDIQDIAQESEGLLEINFVMQNIASQTNLLAMNAAIEAAHAGESGRGFAVVADEIRKLAENSSQQSKTISAVLKKIKSSIDTITKSTGIVLQRFETITREVETVSNQEFQIRNAMEEQEAGSKQILEAVSQLNSVTDLVKTTSSDMAGESKNAMTQSSSLKQISNEISGGMDEMNMGASQINTAVNEVNEISIKNKNNIASLKEEISKFRIG